MKRGSAGRHLLGVSMGCIVLGVLFLRSASVDHESNDAFAHRLDQIETYETRLNEDVLRARQGFVGNYDGLVRDMRTLERLKEKVSALPGFVDDRGREEYSNELERYREASEEKGRLTERFKSTNAALRNSLVYFPIVARDLLDESRKFEGHTIEPIEDLRIAVMQYVNSHREDDRKRAVDALARSTEIQLSDVSTSRLVDNARLHARNILDRRPVLDRLTERILGAPIDERILALRKSYSKGALRAEAKAHRYRTVLYLFAVVLIAWIGLGFAALEESKLRLEEANEGLDQRVRRRTAALEELNRKLEISRKEQLELKDRFLSHVSHELRTPLAAIHQFVELLLDGIGGEVSDEQRQYLTLAFKNVRQLEAMISDLMDAIRAENGKLRVEARPIDLHQLMDEVVQGFQVRSREQSIPIETSAQTDLPQVLADATRVRQILNNLIENAFKFTESKGRIVIDLTRDMDTPGFLRVSVRDSGRGIPPAEAQRIFDRLHQVSEEDAMTRAGLGLGLSICKDLIERQRGRIWVESTIGRGSAFHFTLPIWCVAEALEPIAKRHTSGASQYGVLRIRIAPRESATSGATVHEQLRWLRDHLLSNVRSDCDVLLPHLSDSEIFIVAAIDEAGMNGMSERIRASLERAAGFDGWAVELEARIKNISSEKEVSEADLVRVAGDVERLVSDPSVWAA